MSAINEGILRAARDNGFAAAEQLNDDMVSTANNTQAGATALVGSLHRVVKGNANAGFIMKSIISGEAPRLVIVVNDGPNSINVFPAVGETMNGVANASQAVAAGATGIFVHTKASGVTDWRAGTIT